ncbi:hypothetical protein C7974DRAFT_375781 [Boeremia exigua]|uniref:uncharacterized protein n=1 Tax=Boeremia exigua TaxID=749465 RepID=UPI001E8EBED0|nr:uncharacterized protein C7974DRAFT_375781 [Boeremia exigua]KAH6633737.1 hypothetical protein C7974DRAFT_375781 [Boeremia exigua]
MNDNIIVKRNLTNDFRKALRLCNVGESDECVSLGRNILDDATCPLYYRMKTMILLESVITDWNDANECRADAEMWLVATRRPFPEIFSVVADEQLHDIRKDLDILTEGLDNEELRALEEARRVEQQEAIDDAEDFEEADDPNITEAVDADYTCRRCRDARRASSR